MLDSEEPTGVSIHTGFPNPATDTSLRSLDLNRLLISHSVSTYFFRIRGHHWHNIGIFDGDIAIVDRALDPHKSDVVIWWQEGPEAFYLSCYKDLPEEAHVWGVITSTIHQLRKRI